MQLDNKLYRGCGGGCGSSKGTKGKKPTGGTNKPSKPQGGGKGIRPRGWK